MAVYFIRQGITGPVKIGVANDVVKRIRQLQTNQPIPLRIIRLVEGGRAEEALLHKRFATKRLNGEWFSFSPEMVDADIGLPALPIPLIKRNFGKTFPDNAYGREICLHQEILTAIGGADALGRRMRQPPWEVVEYQRISPRYWSATALLLIEAGRHDITLDMLFEAQAARLEDDKSIALHNEKVAAGRRAEAVRRREAEWITKHGPTAAWWPLPEPEAPDAPAASEASAA